jgi:hypothetical protein
VLVDLPYGTRKTKTSQGETIELPSTIRLHRNSEILRLYETYLKEIGKEYLMLSRSTMLRILEACSAYRQKSMQCVDYYIADGFEVII